MSAFGEDQYEKNEIHNAVESYIRTQIGRAQKDVVVDIMEAVTSAIQYGEWPDGATQQSKRD
jgi:hypothetical protein